MSGEVERIRDEIKQLERNIARCRDAYLQKVMRESISELQERLRFERWRQADIDETEFGGE